MAGIGVCRCLNHIQACLDDMFSSGVPLCGLEPREVEMPWVGKIAVFGRPVLQLALQPVYESG